MMKVNAFVSGRDYTARISAVVGLWMGFIMFAGLNAVAAEGMPQIKLLDCNRIWDQAVYNSFTDLAYHDGQFYCVFREGTKHVSPDGEIRVLSSADGFEWKSCGFISLPGYDLRDPKIDVFPDGKRLMILGGAAVREGSQPSTEEHSFVSISEDGKSWSKPEWVYKQDCWLWRVTWFKGTAYGVAYHASKESRSTKQYGSTLVKSTDGLNYEEVVPSLYTESGPTEATLRFADDGTGYCLHRRDGKESNTALLGTSQPPYTEWTWKDLGVYFGGPNLIQAGKYWVGAGRLKTDDGMRTVVAVLDVEEGKLTPVLTLPSGGDTSYPGLVWRDGILWMSYYSSHEEKTSIYIAKIAVE